jgi:hypothetical protein
MRAWSTATTSVARAERTYRRTCPPFSAKMIEEFGEGVHERTPTCTPAAAR